MSVSVNPCHSTSLISGTRDELAQVPSFQRKRARIGVFRGQFGTDVAHPVPKMSTPDDRRTVANPFTSGRNTAPAHRASPAGRRRGELSLRRVWWRKRYWHRTGDEFGQIGRRQPPPTKSTQVGDQIRQSLFYWAASAPPPYRGDDQRHAARGYPVKRCKFFASGEFQL